MSEKNYNLSADFLAEFMIKVFQKIGVPKAEAKICSEILIEADLRGIDSHGVNRLKPIYYDRYKQGTLDTKTNFEIIKQTSTTAVVDGHNGMGFVVAKKCMEMAIRKAKKHGLGMVVARNSTHFGIAGYYATMASEAGMIGQVTTNARPSIAPTFGVENMLGTNPLTFGIPTDEPFPFVLDCATSVTQRGKIEYYERTGQPTPPGLVIGRDGETMTDSAQILKDLVNGSAALVPLGGIGEDTGGYKGYGYATVVEILSSALQSGNFLWGLSGVKDGKPASIELGHSFLAINIEAFVDLETFKQNTGEVLRELRASAKAPGQNRIYTAGEKEYIARIEREKSGIPLPPSVQRDFSAMKKQLNLRSVSFPWE
ncbi:MAG: Ldh family oxidoreductase [Candidatus Margulisbacteria bacterium]|nr:Ldh family oxidoreductase [Candidatus Margulisiibacteriota bacterium]